MPSETVLSAQSQQAAAGTTTVATVRVVGNRPVEHMSEIRARLEMTTALVGAGNKLDIYFQRPTQPDPGDDDWQDFYHFPQIDVAAGLKDYEICMPLPPPQDVNGVINNASREVVQETLSQDNIVSGHWGDQIRIREVTVGTIDTQGIYNIHMVGR